MLTLSAAVGAVLGVVGLTDNEPTARVVSVGAVGFVVGMVMRATTLSGPSVITSNPAICDHFKTGQRSRAQDMKLFYRGSASLGKFFSISL